MRIKDLSFFCVAAALVAISVGFRIWRLDHIPGINGDEAWLGWKALRLIQGEPIQWTTNTGNLPNIFYFLPLVWLHTFLSPSFTLLRVLAVAAGVLCLPVNFFLCRRVFDRNTAWVSTLLLAVLPVNIAYSRFGWEPSESVLFSFPVIYLALLIIKDETRSRRWLAWSVPALAAAIIVHPTNVFLTPFPIVALWMRWPDQVHYILNLRRSGTRGGLFYGALALSIGAGIYWRGGLFLPRLLSLAWLTDIPASMLGCFRLFSGQSTYQYIPGAGHWTSLFLPDLALNFNAGDAAAIALALPGLLPLLGQMRCARQAMKVERGLCWALTWSTLAFFLLAGAAAFELGNARYALWMVAPGTLVWSRGLVLQTERRPRLRPVIYGGIGILCGVLLAGFYLNYFQFFLQTGGNAEMTFRTAQVEPKEQALNIIERDQNLKRRFVVACSDWWLYWPLRYLSMDQQNLVMLRGDEMGEPRNSALLNAALQSGDLWFVEFAGTQALRQLEGGLRASQMEFDRYVVRSYGDAPVVVLLHPKARTSPVATVK